MAFDENEDGLMDRKQAAKYLNLAPHTLAVWDCTGRYDLSPIKIGRAVRYRRSSLDRFIERNLMNTNNLPR